MIFFNNNNKHVFLLIGVPLFLLLSIIIVQLFTNQNPKLDLTSNNFLPKLKKEYVNKIERGIGQNSNAVYFADFLETNFERTLVLIKKNPLKHETNVNFNIHVFPKDKKKYSNLNNYNEKGFLDFSTTIQKPILYTSKNDLYSVLKVNLPFIDIEKIFIHQPGIWKQTFKMPFKKLKNVNYSLKPTTNLYEPLIHQILNENGIGFSNNIKEKTIGIVKDSKSFWNLISKNNSAFLKGITFNGKNKKAATKLITDLSTSSISFSEVFNIDKLASYYAILNFFSNNEFNQIGFIYNPKKNNLEPYFLNQKQIGTFNTFVKNEILDLDFLTTFTKKLEKISNTNIQQLVNNTPKLSSIIKSANNKNPNHLFSSNLFSHNKLVIQKSIYPAITIKSEFVDMTKHHIRVSIKNLSSFPIEIISLNYKKNKKIVVLDDPIIISSENKDTVTFNLPRSFENLFVHKKSKTTGFIFEKNIFDLRITHKIVGLNNIYYSDIIPYQPTNNYNKNEDLFRKKNNISIYPFLKIDNTTILFKESFTLNKPLILPKDYTVNAKPGIVINIVNGGKIISHSPIHFIGTKEKPIKIISKDKDGQGLLILADGKKSILNFVYFDGLTNPSHGMWSTSSAITFYESPVVLDYCKIANNSCEDALNIVRSKFEITNTSFINTQSDAFDGDFVDGYINSCTFYKIGNDAIDVSGSNLNVSNIKIANVGDKGISAGENSHIIASKITIADCEIAVASKDLSSVILDNITIKNTKLGFTAFQKKPEFGASKINVNNIKMQNVETNYLIENSSTLLVDNDTIKTKISNVKSKMYGVEFGVSSKDTKTRKK